MKAWKFQTTNEYFDLLDFHDCCVGNIQVIDDSIIVQFEFIYISAEHPLNPFEVAKSTDSCELTFHGVTHSEAVLYLEDNVEQSIPEIDLKEMEALKFDQRKIDDANIFELFGTDWSSHGFCGWKIYGQSFSLSWNEFTDDAWYVCFETQE